MALFQAIVKTLTGRKSAVQAADTLEQASSWDPSKSWYGSEEEELEERAQEQVWESLEDARVSTSKRRVLFAGGLRVTLPQAVGHLQKNHSELSHEIVEGAMLEWLETNTAPENVTQEQMDAHDEFIKSWVASYWQKQDQMLENS
jgi:hypothetical protein